MKKNEDPVEMCYTTITQKSTYKREIMIEAQSEGVSESQELLLLNILFPSFRPT